MKKLFLILLSFTSISFAQDKSYRQYRDYQVLSNIDSLQKVVNSQRDKSSLSYLNSLIELEMSRNFYSTVFGKDLESIKTVAIQKKIPIALAMYHLLKAIKSRKDDSERSLSSALKARAYFEQQKDTLGILHCNDRMIMASFDNYLIFEDKKKALKPIFENSLSYYYKTKDIEGKLRICLIVLRYAMYFDMDINKRLTFFKNAIKLLDEYPQYDYFRYSIFSGAANVYYRMPDNKVNNLRKVQWCYLKAYQSLKSNQEIIKITALNNLGDSYINLNEFKQAEILFKQAIALYEKIKDDDIGILLAIYNNLSQAQYKQKEYKDAYENRIQAEILQSNIDKKLKTKELRELLTKYETEKKDVAIKNLELQRQATDARTRLGLLILFLTFFIIAAVSFLALRLRNANIRLKKLTQSRDKLFTIISHDLRSPFNSYQRYSEIVGYLVKTKQYVRLEEVLKKIDVVGLNLSALLNNLLEWSIVQQKQIKVSLSVINIQDFFNHLLPIYRDMAKLKDVAIIEDIQDQTITVDRQLLSLIARNLLDNAIKYTPNGNEILLNATLKENHFVLTISNRGDSMTDSQREKIEALFNNNYDYEFGEEGLGIGLILIKEFARANCVSISFEHSDDKLTTFKVTVPQTKNLPKNSLFTN